MSLLCCEKAAFGYEGQPIIRDLSFSVEAGDYLCVVGENGSGKSTLMKTLLGLTPLLAGKIETGEGLKPGEIGYLPQQTQVQRDFPASVWEIVLSGCQSQMGWRPFYGEKEKQTAMKHIRRMGLEELRLKSYRELSGGQQQRVLLARALCATKRMLLLDEPAAGLDPRVTVEMYQLIADLNKNDGITIVMISHDLHAALQYASHVLHIGRKIFFGTKEEYVSSGMMSGWETEERI